MLAYTIKFVHPADPDSPLFKTFYTVSADEARRKFRKFYPPAFAILSVQPLGLAGPGGGWPESSTGADAQGDESGGDRSLRSWRLLIRGF